MCLTEYNEAEAMNALMIPDSERANYLERL